MWDLLIFFALGGITCILGAINMTGNISTLHWYHRHRVTEENRLPYGRLVGIGTLVIGIGIILYGVLNFISVKTQLSFVNIVGIVEIIASFIVGGAISVYAMIKYNRGIF